MNRLSLSDWHRTAPPLQHARQRTAPARKRETVVNLHDLTPQQLHRRTEAALQFSRQIGGDFSDSFHLGEKLTDLLGDPEAVDSAVEEARQAVQGGRLSQDRAVERLMPQFGKNASGEDSRLLATAFRRCLSDQRPFGKLFAEAKEEAGEIPDEREREMMSYCREQHALQFQRAFGVELPADEFIPDGELRRTIELLDRRPGLSFDRALSMVRTGR
jgi:hypothetical protein